MQIKINPTLTPDIIFRCASLHKSFFPKDHFSSLLSVNTLSCYYNCIFEQSNYSIIAFDGDEVVGFLFAGSSYRGIQKKMILNNTFDMILTLLKHPKYLIEKLFTYNKYVKTTSDYRILSIVVNNHKRKVRGVDLLKTLFMQANTNIGLSVNYKNINAINFYFRNGFIVDGFSGKNLLLSKC
jgi:hypothetical protein